MAKFATAALGSAAPLPTSLFIDPIVAARTVFNDERTHRLSCFQHWGDPDDYVCGIGMNPSGAAEDRSDPTFDAMCRRARAWGAGAHWQLNVMSIRGTYSADLAKAQSVSLPENDDWIRRVAPKARLVIVHWGNPGHDSGRGPKVERLLREVCDPAKVFCFGKNLNGAPTHSLYQRMDAPLLPFFPADSA